MNTSSHYLKNYPILFFSCLLLFALFLNPFYLPDSSVCGQKGESDFYGVYYKTRTAYYKGVLKNKPG